MASLFEFVPVLSAAASLHTSPRLWHKTCGSKDGETCLQDGETCSSFTLHALMLLH
jgi:hypothetical protein